MLHNFTYISQNLVSWSLQGYVSVLGYFFMPLMFCIVAGYVYLNQRSYVAAAVTILILFSIFGEMMIGVETFAIIMHIVIALIVTALLLIFLTKVRR